MAEIVYAIQIILGIDDLDASCPKLMPRIPIGWTDATINEWPIRAMASGESILTKLSTSIKRDPACKRFDMTITTKKPLDKLKVRLGPFTDSASALTVKVNGTVLSAQLLKSGDSKWAWIELKGAADYNIESKVR
ncbi:MAG: hypothetical protein ABFD54_17390 [Armatimonadota bacterium]